MQPACSLRTPRRLVAALACLLWLAAPSSGSADPRVDQRLADMDLAARVGQLFLISFPGDRLGPETRASLRRLRPAGAILYRTNTAGPAEVARLSSQLQAAVQSAGGPGLLLAIDMEGGRVNRFFADRGFTRFPPGLLVAATRRPRNAAAVARAMATELTALGFNTNLAPVADLWLPGGGRALGLRTFGSEPGPVAALVGAFVRASQKAGVLSCPKHFPGLGAGRVDSHADLPIIERTRAELLSAELLPFRAAAAAGAGAFMIGHAWFPGLDPNKRTPASMSEPVVGGLLRAELGFDGLVVTDALDMGAVQANHTYAEAAVQALSAGADLVAFGSTPTLAEQERAVSEVIQAVERGRLSASRVERSVRRVLAAKARFGLLGARGPDPEMAAGAMGVDGHRRLVADLARQAITLVRDDRAALPLRPGRRRAWILSAGLEPLVAGCAALTTGDEVLVLPAEPGRADRLAAVQAADQATWVIFATASRFDPELARELPAGKLVAVATADPTALLQVPGAPTWVVTYSAQPPSLAALCDLLAGRLAPAGRLPIGLGSRAPAGSGLSGFVPARP